MFESLCDRYVKVAKGSNWFTMVPGAEIISMFCFALTCLVPSLSCLVGPFENFCNRPLSGLLWLSEYLISFAPSAPVLLHFELACSGAGVTSKGSDH